MDEDGLDGWGARGAEPASAEKLVQEAKEQVWLRPHLPFASATCIKQHNCGRKGRFTGSKRGKIKCVVGSESVMWIRIQ